MSPRGAADATGPRTVVHLMSSAAPAGAAQARIVATLARELDPERYALQAWFLEGGGPLETVLQRAGVEVRVIGVGGLRDLAGVMRFVKALRREQPAILHFHLGGRSRIWPARAFSRAKRVVHLHGAYREDGSPLDARPLLRGADVVIACSRAVARELAPSAEVIYTGVSADRPAATLDASPPTIGTVARLEPVKGISSLIEAAAELLPRHPDLQVEIAGSGSAEPLLRSLARDRGIKRAVTFLGWREDVASLHRRWRTFVVPSIREGLPVATLEAMAAGLPVVAFAVGGLEELVEDGGSGYLVPAGNVPALASRIDALLTDSALRARLGRSARARVQERFTVAAMVRAVNDVYREVLP